MLFFKNNKRKLTPLTVKANLRISLLVAISVCVFSFEKIGASDNKNTETNKDVKSDQENNDSKNLCAVLSNWVKSDLKDKPFSFGHKKEERRCISEKKKEHDSLIYDHRKNNNQLKDGYINNYDKLRKSIQKKLELKLNIESNKLEALLDSCESSMSKVRSIPIRLITAVEKIESTNLEILDEVAYYDRVLQNPKGTGHSLDYNFLKGINCDSILKNTKIKCNNYKSSDVKTCHQNGVNPINELVNQTKESIGKLNQLEDSLDKCFSENKITPEKKQNPSVENYTAACHKIYLAMEMIKDTTPWIRGETFRSIAVKQEKKEGSVLFKKNTTYNENKFYQAIANQLEKNRKALVKTYNNNIDDINCIVNGSETEKCDINKIRGHLVSQSNIDAKKIFQQIIPEEIELTIEVESDQCLMKLEEDQHQLNNTLKEVGYTVVLTAATLGMGWVSGLKAINSASKLGRSLAISNGAFGAGISGIDVKDSFKECADEAKTVIKLSSQNNVNNGAQNSNVGSGNSRDVCSLTPALKQAYDEETNCLLSALLSVPGVAPFLGSSPALLKLASRPSIKRSAKSIKNVDETELIKNAQTMQEFVKNNDYIGAKKYINNVMKRAGENNLTDSQIEGIWQAHTDVPCVIGECNLLQLHKKNKIMRETGLSPNQSKKAIERGLAGNFDESQVSDGNLNKFNMIMDSDSHKLRYRTSLEDIEVTINYLQGKVNAHNPNRSLAVLKVQTEEKEILEYLKRVRDAKIEGKRIYDESMSRRIATTTNNEHKIAEARLKSEAGRILTDSEKTTITNQIEQLSRRPSNSFSNEEVNEFIKTRETLKNKDEWVFKDPIPGGVRVEGMASVDSEIREKFVKALNKVVSNIEKGRGNLEYIARAQDRVSIMEPDIIYDKLKSVDASSLTNSYKEYIEYAPVIDSSSDLNAIKRILKNYRIEEKEITSANVLSTFTKEGVDQYSNLRNPAFEFANKIKLLITNEEFKKEFTNHQLKVIQRLYEVSDHQKSSFQPPHLFRLKRYSE